MSKGTVREVFPVKREREADLGGGGTIDVGSCGPRKVQLMLTSTKSSDDLQAMGATYLHLDERKRLILRNHAREVAQVISEVAELRRCIERGVRFEADLATITVRGGLAVQVRPVTTR